MRNLMTASVVILVTCLAAAAWSVGAASFEVKTPEQVNKGTLDGVVAETHGRLTLGFDKKELLKEDTELFWALAVDPAGTIYAGTSHKGHVRIVRADKPAAPVTVEDAALFAAAVATDGTVYVGGSPSGNVYKAGKVFCKTGQSYIWAMHFARNGDLYVATGPDGKVLRVNRAGTAVTVIDSADPHVLSLAADSKGNLYAGTSKSGLIYRLKPDGTSEVIYDAAEGEIRAMVVDEEDNLYFGTADVKSGAAGSRGPVGISSARPPTVGGGPGKGPTPSRPAPSPAPIRDDVSATNAIYRMSPGGNVIKLYSIRGKMILSMLWEKGTLYAGTGNKGNLVRIDENLDVTVLEKDLEKQVLSLATDARGGILMGTGYKGRILRYAAGFLKEGQYTSQVFDAKFPARFGALAWQGKLPPGTSVEVTTQSGNVAEPDASWSAWSAPYVQTGQKITSPGARFIRYRLKFRTVKAKNTPHIDSVAIAYLTSNQPPRIESIKVTTPRDNNAKAKKPKSDGQVQLSWKAADPNGDAMQYRVEFRVKGDAGWRELEKKTDKTSYTWKTDAVPDGSYEVRITASDAADNPPDAALAHYRVSEPFVVDNTRPTVTVTVRPGAIGAGKSTANVTITDKLGKIVSAEYSLDSGDWRKLLPTDRIFDSAIETCTIDLADLKPGEHTITVRVSDDSGNAGAGGRTFTQR